MARSVIALVLVAQLALVALAVDCTKGGVCTKDSDCNGANPAGFWKVKDDGTVECETVDSLACCNGLCIDTRVHTCNDDGSGCWASGSNVQCTKTPATCLKYQKSCFDTARCYNPVSQSCQSYGTVNDQKISWISNNEVMTPLRGFFIVGIPVIFLVATIVATLLGLLLLKPNLGSLDLPCKIVVLCALLSILFGLFFFFSNSWEYAVVIVTAAVIVLISMPPSKGPLMYFCLAVQTVLFLYLLGPFPNSNILLSYGGGLIPSLGCGGGGNYGNYFTYDTQRFSSWNTKNPSSTQWGYCGTGFIVWQHICAAFCIILSGFGWVIHLYVAFAQGKSA